MGTHNIFPMHMGRAMFDSHPSGEICLKGICKPDIQLVDIYKSVSRKNTRQRLSCQTPGTSFDALDWLALLTTHIPNKNEQMVRHYGYYSNKSRGLRKKEGTDEDVAALIDSDNPLKYFRKNWAQMVQKVYNVDPLECPKCHGPMRIISVIEDTEVFKNILKHLDLWDIRSNSPPVQERAQHSEFTHDDAFSLLPETDYWTQ